MRIFQIVPPNYIPVFNAQSIQGFLLGMIDSPLQNDDVLVYDQNSKSFTYQQILTGYTGPTGATGHTGSQGVIGPPGVTGFQGHIGKIGITGEAGEKGYYGPKGVTGATGSVGPIGAQGDTGLLGQRGSIGFTGIQGFTGDRGFIGPQGNMGPRGPTGYGPIGKPGLVGDPGKNLMYPRSPVWRNASSTENAMNITDWYETSTFLETVLDSNSNYPFISYSGEVIPLTGTYFEISSKVTVNNKLLCVSDVGNKDGAIVDIDTGTFELFTLNEPVNPNGTPTYYLSNLINIPNGNVLILPYTNGATNTRIYEFNPFTNTVTNTATFPGSKNVTASCLIPNGNVFLYEGLTNTPYIYNTVTKSLTPITPNPLPQRFYVNAIPLSDGNIYLACNTNVSSVIYNPQTNTVVKTYPSLGGYFTGIVRQDGTLLLSTNNLQTNVIADFTNYPDNPIIDQFPFNYYSTFFTLLPNGLITLPLYGRSSNEILLFNQNTYTSEIIPLEPPGNIDFSSAIVTPSGKLLYISTNFSDNPTHSYLTIYPNVFAYNFDINYLTSQFMCNIVNIV